MSSGERVTTPDCETRVDADVAPGGGIRWKVALIVAATLVLALLVGRHVAGMNGPWYWKWPWRDLPFFPLYPALAIAATPIALAAVAARRRRDDDAAARAAADGRRALALLTLGTLALSLAAAFFHTRPYGVGRLVSLVRSPMVNSYFSDAAALHENFAQDPNLSTRVALREWPVLLPHLHLHSKYKPPGLVLYYLFWITLLGPGDGAAAAGGIALAVLGALRVPAAYALVRRLARDRDAALCTATLLALAPGAVLFLPVFDTLYPALACALLILWDRALENGRAMTAAAFGLLLALCLFFSYIFLVFGLFFIAHALLQIAAGPAGTVVRRVVRQGAIAAGAVVAFYGVLYLGSGFDPIETARTIAALQMRDLIPLGRPFPRHIVFDVLDFAMSAGWVVLPLVAFLFLPPHPALRSTVSDAAHGGGIARMTPAARFVFLCLLQIATVALAALLPGEAARLWLPMLPLLLAPAGLELSRWPPAARRIAYACVWLMLAVICQNMALVWDPFQRPPALATTP